jgi:hypothetical protein
MGHGLAGGPSETVSAHNEVGSHNEVGPPGIVRTNAPWFTSHTELSISTMYARSGVSYPETRSSA